MSLKSVATILLAYLCLASAKVVNISITPIAKEEYRLPNTIVPVNYNLKFKPYLNESEPKAFTFDGEAFIEIIVKQNTKTILIHSKNLNYTVREFWNKEQPNRKIALNATAEPNYLTDIITYNLNDILIANRTYVLHFIYSGTLINDDLFGFYSSHYVDNKNVTKWLCSTQFQPNHARRAFPSFDEPKFKATFEVSLVRHKTMKSFSNTRIIKSINKGTYHTDIFAPTPLMSTYVLAFMVSDYNGRQNNNFSVIAPLHNYNQTEYGYDVGQMMLYDFNNYFGLAYNELGIDKLHMASIPQHNADGMENWGLITYSTSSLLYESGVTPLSLKQEIASIIAHELAHMWFGNLVTCDWWSYAWLNEGFASYFQNIAVDKIEPNFEMEKQYVINKVHPIMYLDSTNNTYPMSDEDTNTSEDLERMFLSITYDKAPSIIRMVKHVMGEENFQKSLKEYLAIYKYNNTKPSDLFTIWKKYWPTNSSSYADSLFFSFTTQVGYPVVTFNLTSATSLEISQKRFLLKTNEGSNPNLTYTIPITYNTNIDKDFNTTTPKLFISNSTFETTVTLPNHTTWVIGNIQQTGYYRVNYDNSTWHNIKRALFEPNWGGIPELNRAQILDDLYNLARADYIDFQLVLEILEYMETETNYLPWNEAFKIFSYFTNHLYDKSYNEFSRYICQMMQKSYNLLGFKEKSSDSALDILNRNQILLWSCAFGNIKCITKAMEYFRKDLKLYPVPVDIRDVVYCTTMREGNQQDFEKLFNMYKSETRTNEKILILQCFACIKDSTLIGKYFNIIMSDDIQSQDKSTALLYMYLQSKQNIELILDLMQQNFEQFAKAMGSYSAVAEEVVKIANRFTTQAHIDKLKSFKESHKDELGLDFSALVDVLNKKLSKVHPKLPTFKNYLHKRFGSLDE